MRAQGRTAHAVAVVTTATIFLLGLTLPALAQSADAQHSVLWVDGRGMGLRSDEAVRETVTTAQDCGFDTIVAVVRSQGDAYHRSSLEPRGSNIAMDFPDPLQAILFETEHASRDVSPELAIRLFAGVNLLSVHRGMTLPPRGHMVSEFPEWVMEDRVGSRDAREQGAVNTFVDPGLPEVRQHTAGAVLEIVQIYGIDGLMLDMARYPAEGSAWGYSAPALESYHRAVGEVGLPEPRDPSFSDWRRDQVTELVRGVVRVVRAERPDLPIWIAVEAAGTVRHGFERSATYAEMFQDWPRWIDEGLCDGIVLKNFFDGRTTEGQEEFREWLGFAQQFEDRVDLTVAVCGDLNYRNSLFNLMREARAETATGSLALIDYDRPARDADADFFPSLKRAIFQASLLDRLQSRSEEPVEESTPERTSGEVASPFLEPPLEVALPEVESPVELEFPAAISTDEDVSGESREGAEEEEITPSDLSDLLPPPGDLALEEFAPVPLPPALGERPEEEYSAADLFGEPAPIETLPRTGVFDAVPAPQLPRPSIADQARADTARDTVTLQDGRQLTGEIVDELDNQILIRLDSGNTIRIPRSRVESVARGMR